MKCFQKSLSEPQWQRACGIKNEVMIHTIVSMRILQPHLTSQCTEGDGTLRPVEIPVSFKEGSALYPNLLRIP